MSKLQQTRSDIAGKQTEGAAGISDLFDYTVFVKLAAVAFGLVMLFIVVYALLGGRFYQNIAFLLADPSYEAGKRLEMVADYRGAERFYRSALTGKFKSKEREYLCRLSLGDMLFRQQRYSEAVEIYNEIPADDFTAAGAYAGYVGALWREGHYDEAKRLGKIWLDKSESADDVQQREWAHYTLGCIYRKTNQPDEALAHYRAVAKLNPESRAKIDIARILHGQGQDVEALRWLDELLSVLRTGNLYEQARALHAQIAGQSDEP